MKVVIVDDVQASAEEVRKMISKHFPQFNITGVYHTINEGIEGIQKHMPELIFLDIELNGGKTGFDLLEKISPRLFEIIFITAHDRFAARAFQYSALHYLLKPIDEILLVQAVNRAIETKKTKDFANRFDTLLNNVRSENLTPQKIMVPNLKSDGWLCLNVSQVVRIDSTGIQAVKITYEEAGKYLFTGVRKTIGEAEKMLEGHDFIRIHESHIVNLKYIEMVRRDQKTLVMSDKEEIKISRLKAGLLKQKMRKM